MKKLLFICGVLITCFYFVRLPVFSAPAEWGIAINDEDEECAGYWAGDEFVSYGLPEGWKAYYPESTGVNAGVIVTPYGKCDFYEGEEECCDSLGLKYVSENIGKTNGEEDEPLGGLISPFTALTIWGVCCCFVLLIVIVIIIILVLIGRKKKV
ncbi:hypothetical protein JW766_00510 [Candidatus Dojkabacteria bacterium]|nr:hypothetical protein [Candidatus Dojkabacteria bacterium]